jgi:hypothetical protein
MGILRFPGCHLMSGVGGLPARPAQSIAADIPRAAALGTVVPPTSLMEDALRKVEAEKFPAGRVSG